MKTQFSQSPQRGSLSRRGVKAGWLVAAVLVALLTSGVAATQTLDRDPGGVVKVGSPDFRIVPDSARPDIGLYVNPDGSVEVTEHIRCWQPDGGVKIIRTRDFLEYPSGPTAAPAELTEEQVQALQHEADEAEPLCAPPVPEVDESSDG